MDPTENLICPACGADLTPGPVVYAGFNNAMDVATQSADCSECGAHLVRVNESGWDRTDGGWQPMTVDEAHTWLAVPQPASGDQAAFARWIEADMVVKGRHPKEIRAALDRVEGPPQSSDS